MTAIATAPVMNDRESERDSRIDHSPSRFTAVNGKDTLPMAPASGGPNHGDNREIPEAWQQAGYDLSTRHEERPREDGELLNDTDEQYSQHSASHDALNPGNRSKRKRSGSNEQEGAHTPYRSLRSPIQLTDGTTDYTSQPAASNGAMSSQSDNETKRTFSQSQSKQDEVISTRRSSTNASWHEYDAQSSSQAPRDQQIDSSDAQLVEALQRDVQGPDAAHKDWDNINRPAEGSLPGEQAHATNTSQDRPQNAAVQIAPRRKRVFSNRTKTGCFTCRRRKKKCDEHHPLCNNCVRGGFVCEGYSSRNTHKPSATKTPIPLQSKEGYSDMGGQYVHDVNRHDRQQSLMEPLDSAKMRPIVVDDDNLPAAQFNTSPTGVGASRGSWAKRTWPSAGHSSYIADTLPKSNYREVPSIHELSREGHSKNDFHLVPPIREISHPTHAKPGVAFFQGGIDQRPAHASNIDTSTPQAQARMALSIEHHLSGRALSSEETEKDKMLRGDLYRPFDVLLVEERERCKAALWRFNNSCNPVYGISAREQNRLLREIFVPQLPANPSGATSSRPTGSVDQSAVVYAPFKCNYGYNVHIGEDVQIHEDCSFVDDCPITIGAHTWIGSRVLILTSMAHATMQERKGTQSRYQGRPVTIEEDCWIGDGCIIYPGVRLRRGANVAPGEVVKSDIVAYGFQGFKPSYM
ncbi:uncharacterized protein BDV14DRAFT_157356 [Aspergillus stella-maris]|uniref:uncharacterized protein n=1 Tax=Aspergillus stella-maris TaxID=1810926 RepID=UPI003CCDB4B5